MKKKLYDLTIRELKEICKKYPSDSYCEKCPIWNICCELTIYPRDFNLKKLAKRVEINNKK